MIRSRASLKIAIHGREKCLQSSCFILIEIEILKWQPWDWVERTRVVNLRPSMTSGRWIPDRPGTCSQCCWRGAIVSSTASTDNRWEASGKSSAAAAAEGQILHSTPPLLRNASESSVPVRYHNRTLTLGNHIPVASKRGLNRYATCQHICLVSLGAYQSLADLLLSPCVFTSTQLDCVERVRCGLKRRRNRCRMGDPRLKDCSADRSLFFMRGN